MSVMKLVRCLSSLPLCDLLGGLASRKDVNMRQARHALQSLQIAPSSATSHTPHTTTTHRRVHEPRSLPLILPPQPPHKHIHLAREPLQQHALLGRRLRAAHELVHRDAPLREGAHARRERVRRGRRRERAREAPEPVLQDARRDRRWEGGREDGEARPDEAVFDFVGD